MINRRIVLASRPEGAPIPANFRLEETALRPLEEGEVLLRILYLSLDPYMRGRMSAAKSYAKPVEVGGVMEGGTVARVLESRNTDYRPGEIVLSHSGWQSHDITRDIRRRVDPDAAPISTALGVLGMPGFTAYVGLNHIGRPKAGETLVVAAASGPVGATVGQIARIRGARTVGIAGGKEKCAYLLDELGFDVALDHRAPDFAGQLAQACPNGVDVYFENVGGAVWDAIFPLLNGFARVPVCGLVAQYNGVVPGTADRLPDLMRQILSRSLHVQGFIQRDYAADFPAFHDEMSGWIAEGKVRYREDIVEGLENAPEAFIGLLEGRNFGKLLVRVAQP
ncbi:NADPH-dependent curcumin reductase [Labrys miyagiensis]